MSIMPATYPPNICSGPTHGIFCTIGILWQRIGFIESLDCCNVDYPMLSAPRWLSFSSMQIRMQMHVDLSTYKAIYQLLCSGIDDPPHQHLCFYNTLYSTHPTTILYNLLTRFLICEVSFDRPYHTIVFLDFPSGLSLGFAVQVNERRR